MRFLILNLSGNSFRGHIIHDALKLKYGENAVVELHELTELARLYIDREKTLEEMVQGVKLDYEITEYDEIIVGAHGLKDNIGNCYWRYGVDGPIKNLFTAEKLAKFLFQLFPDYQTTLKTELNVHFIVCYAARTSRFNQDHVDANIITDNEFIERSFAGNFLQHFGEMIQQSIAVNLKAYIGAVSFDLYKNENGILCGSGEILCEPETVVLRSPDREADITKKLYESMQRNDEESIEFYSRMKTELQLIKSLPGYGLIKFNSRDGIIQLDLSAIRPRPAVVEEQEQEPHMSNPTLKSCVIL